MSAREEIKAIERDLAARNLASRESVERKVHATPPAKVVHHCGTCGRRLRENRWVYSRHTGARYCFPGEGCQKPSKRGASS